MGELRGLTRTERRALLAAVVTGVAVRLLYVVSTRGHRLVGDEPGYHASAVLQAAGKWFWSTAPYGIPHASTQKAPGYQVWAGLWYEVLGTNPDRLFAAQAVLLGPLVVVLTFLLARRLFGSWAAIGAAAVAALHPNVWQWEVRMYSESLALPLTLLFLLVVLTRPPTRRVVLGLGVLLGVLVLVRPTSLFLLVLPAVLWTGRLTLRRGALATGATAAVAVLVVAPWSIRNATLDDDHWVPISVQDAAAYGTFNDDAANDREYPWKWRPYTRRDADLLDPRRPRSDGAFRAELRERTLEYVKDHPASLPKAFWHNGIVRTWDLDPPGQSLDDAAFTGTSRTLTGVGLALYWLTVPLALLGLAALWRSGRSRTVLALALMAATLSVLYTSEGATRYRAPIEPLIVVLAAGGAVALVRRRRTGAWPAAPAG